MGDVFVSYLDSNKILSIPEKEGLKFLKEEFVKSFSLERRVKSIKIRFQRFKANWNDYVDLEELDDIHHRDKLRAVVTSLTGTGTGLSTATPPAVEVGSYTITILAS